MHVLVLVHAYTCMNTCPIVYIYLPEMMGEFESGHKWNRTRAETWWNGTGTERNGLRTVLARQPDSLPAKQSTPDGGWKRQEDIERRTILPSPHHLQLASSLPPLPPSLPPSPLPFTCVALLMNAASRKVLWPEMRGSASSQSSSPSLGPGIRRRRRMRESHCVCTAGKRLVAVRALNFYYSFFLFILLFSLISMS